MPSRGELWERGCPGSPRWVSRVFGSSRWVSRVFASRGSVGVPGLRVPGLRAYIATDEGWLYLAAVIDLFSR